MIRVDDKDQDAIEDEKRATDKKTRLNADQFKRSMLSHVGRSAELARTKQADKSKEKAWKESSSLKPDKKSVPDADASEMDSILKVLEGEEKKHEEYVLPGQRQRRPSTAKSSLHPHEEEGKKNDESHRALETAIVGPSHSKHGKGDSDAGAFSGNPDDDRDLSRSRWEEEPLHEGAKVTHAGSARFETLLERKAHRIPRALLDQMSKCCRVLLDGEQTVLELTLSRQLFGGITIRISKDKSKMLTIEFVTASKDIATFFEEKRGEITLELGKRGLAVDQNRVIVSAA